MVKRMILWAKNIRKREDEIYWAMKWHDTLRGIEWAENIPSLSPGDMAVGYNYLYVVTRILNEVEPEKILDMGLGISSTLISQYVISNKKVYHFITEHDAERYGEKNMIKSLTQKLENCKIKYYSRTYSSESDICVIASEKYRFLCTL